MESSALVYIILTVVTILFALCIENRECRARHVRCLGGDGMVRSGGTGESGDTGSGAFCAAGVCTRTQARNRVAEFAIYCLLAGVSACRIAVGNDYWPYRFNFRLIAQERLVSSEFGFNLIVKWMQKLFGYDNYLPIFALFSLMTVWFFVRALHAQAGDYAFCLFLLMTGGYYFNSLNTVRYYLALAVAFYAMQYVLRGEYGKFIFWVLFGMMFHKTILLVIPAYLTARFLSSAKLKKWHCVAAGILLLSLVFCQNFYREIVFYFYPYYRNSEFDRGNISWANLAKCVAALALCAVCYRRSIKDNTVNRFYFFLNGMALVVFACGTFIPEVSRAGYYLIISQVVLLPELIHDMPKGKFRLFCKIGVIGAFTLYFALLLKGMYATDIRLLPYLNWIFN